MDLPLPNVDRLLGRIRAARVRPAVFALYTKLVQAIELDDAGKIARLAAELSDPKLLGPPDHRIITLASKPLLHYLPSQYCGILDHRRAVTLHLHAVTNHQLHDDNP